MKKSILVALVATVAMSACAPKSHHHDEPKAAVTKPSAETKPTPKAEPKAEVKTTPAQTPAPAPQTKPSTPATQTSATEAPASQPTVAQPSAKAEAPAPAPIASSTAPKSEAQASQEEKIPIFGQDFVCKEEFLTAFPPFQKAFAEAARETDEALIAMKPVVEKMDDSSGYHAKVLANYQALTKAYKVMLKEFGETFGCFYMAPKGRQIKITSDNFKADYDQLRARVGAMIGKQNLGPEINDI